jgi:putative transposase
MQLTERHIIKKSHPQFKACDNACFLSKNLYNAALYRIKQEFLLTGKWLRYNDLEREFKLSNQPDYRFLTNNTSQQILMLLDKNLKSYFQAIKVWKRDNKKFTGCPVFPRYKDKEKGRNIVVYTYVQLNLKNDGIIKFPKREGLLPLKTFCKKEYIQQVRIIPQSSCYMIEVVYNFEEKIKEPNSEYLSIDLGINNLTTCTSTIQNQGFIINGKPLKSINQFYNKKLAKLKSSLEKNHKRKSSNKTKKLTLKRNNKINHYLHHTSKEIVSYCVKNNIDNIVVGKNDLWKSEVNLGKRNNQNFVQIPFDRLEQQISYKAKKEGITFTTINEAYTSKCSALDLETVQKHEHYLGKRIKRGLFKTSDGTLINSDINGSLNILRKVTGRDDFVIRSGIGLVMNPLKINL